MQTLALPLGHVTIFGATVAAPFGAADEARTRYLHLGKVALYQMSYGRIFGAFYLAPIISDALKSKDFGAFFFCKSFLLCGSGTGQSGL